MSTVTRFPPSPTGDLHIGGARTALFNWLYARKTGGQFILRIEDTDEARSTEEATRGIFAALEWLGLDWGRGPFYQSKRRGRYEEVIRGLLAEGKAYYCDCSQARLEEVRKAQRAAGEKPRYDRRCRERGLQGGTGMVVRFANPLEGKVVFDDVVRGRVAIDNAELDDLVIARGGAEGGEVGAPTYNLCVVVDDMDMGVTHVIRGDDHTNNTPRQINLFEALGGEVPVYAHVPLIVGANGQRLSKRDGAAGVLQYREMGILPQALLNYLLRLGWAHGDQEIFSREEMVKLFALEGINRAPAAFDMAKLLWVNQQYIKQAAGAELAAEVGARVRKGGGDLAGEDAPAVEEVVEALRERAQTLQEMADKAGYLYGEVAEYEEKAAGKHLRGEVVPVLEAAGVEFGKVAEGEWGEEGIEEALQAVMRAQGCKLGVLAQALRVAVSGGAATPPIALTLRLVGRRRTLARVEAAVRWIGRRG